MSKRRLTGENSSTLSTGIRLIRTLRGSGGEVQRIAWSPDGGKLAVPTSKGIIHVWETATWRLVTTFEGHTDGVSEVAWSPDGRCLAAASRDATVRIWEPWAPSRTLAKRDPHTWPFSGHSGPVTCLTWSPNGMKLVSGGNDGKVLVWDVQSGEPVDALRTRKSHTIWPFITALALSIDGRTLATASYYGNIQLAELDQVDHWKEKKLFPARMLVRDLAWSPDSSVLAICGGHKSFQNPFQVALFAEPWDRPIRILYEGSKENETEGCAFSRDGLFFAAKVEEEVVVLWRCDRWEVVGRFAEASKGGHERRLAFHPTRPLLATANSQAGEIRIWELNTANLLRS